MKKIKMPDTFVIIFVTIAFLDKMIYNKIRES